MAIKGKRRTRATRRGIATAPRPHLVIPRKPLLRRRGVQITLVVILLAVIGGLVVWGLRTRSTNAAEDIAGLQPDLAELREARNLMRRGLELYSAAAETLAVAARLEGQQQKNLIASLEKQVVAAGEGWGGGGAKAPRARIRI